MPSLKILPLVLAVATVLTGCKKSDPPAGSKAPTNAETFKVGLVTDVAGRGDQSFNDSALRGLELWAAAKRVQGSRTTDVPAQERLDSLPAEFRNLPPLPVTPLVLQSKAPEDYEPNLQLLVDQGAALVIGVGFLLENAVEAVAKRNPGTKFLLIDSSLIDASGNAYQLPNVRCINFREEEGSFLAGALAGLVTQTQHVGFIGGMEVPLIKRFESGYRAGVLTTNPKAAENLVVGYSGSFTHVGAGKAIATDFLAKSVDVLYHAAGSSGLGVIQGVKEAKAQGKQVFAIGVDSDQYHLAPDAVLTSVVKRLDATVYRVLAELVDGNFTAKDETVGVAENAVVLADIRIDIPDREKVLGRVEALRKKIVAKELKVPVRTEELAAFKAPL